MYLLSLGVVYILQSTQVYVIILLMQSHAGSMLLGFLLTSVLQFQYFCFRTSVSALQRFHLPHTKWNCLVPILSTLVKSYLFQAGKHCKI